MDLRNSAILKLARYVLVLRFDPSHVQGALLVFGQAHGKPSHFLSINASVRLLCITAGGQGGRDMAQ